MSVTFSSKSRVVQEATVNLMASDNRSKYGWRPQLSVWWIGAAAACLGFLLLILILGVVAHNSKAIGHQDSKCENRISSLTADRDALRDERYQLKLDSINLTKEMEVLRDTLQEEVNRLNLSKKDEPCQEGWKTFNGKCYYFSTSGVTRSWESSRKYCKERGADLVIITTKEELNFVVQSYRVTWIGLSDREQENSWKWVDGSDLIDDGFWQVGEPNNHQNDEHCAEVSRSAKRFNDVPCERKFSWACEN
uniref:C-type lectin domain-containing protein n=1 Tax=Cyclopterus lumpus TaxID=8103 RepID=A0A8C2X300_CYCLU